VMAGSGREVQSVADSSFDAWTKFYRQDENASNTIVSYYKKGSLVALCLDLHIRAETAGRRSLDDAMRAMWRRHGRDFYRGTGTGIDEDEFPALVLEATGVDVSEPVAQWAYGTRELPLDALLTGHGLTLRFEPRQVGPWLGARIATSPNECRIAAVDAAGPAHAAGLSAGDVLVALDGLRALPGKVETILSRYREGDVVDVAAFRGDLLQTRALTLGAAPSRAIIEPSRSAAKALRTRREKWLKG
jgi:predicted metalloprotease with PDZ domain